MNRIESNLHFWEIFVIGAFTSVDLIIARSALGLDRSRTRISHIYDSRKFTILNDIGWVFKINVIK